MNLDKQLTELGILFNINDYKKKSVEILLIIYQLIY